MFLQRTIRKSVSVKGVGLHSGVDVELTFKPAPANSGIRIVRADLPHRPQLAVTSENITATQNATTLGGPDFSVATVEHCLAALAVLRLDNLVIELSGPEIPIGDGSAWPFWNAIKSVGVAELDQPRKYLFVQESIYLGDESRHAYVTPYNGLRLTCTIDFSHPRIRSQSIDIDINPHSFESHLAKARTFGFLKEVEALRAKGLIAGGSLENAVVLDDDGIINHEGLRYPDEFVRHKAMDALGDLVTLGYPVMGHVVLYRAGHDLMNRFVKQILLCRDKFKLMELGTDLTQDFEQGRSAWAMSEDIPGWSGTGT